MNGLPAYADGAGVPALEQSFATRDVIYLLGAADIDPNHTALDETYMAEAQEATRYARGQAYFAALQRQFGSALRQTIADMPWAGHNDAQMFDAPVGIGTIFD